MSCIPVKDDFETDLATALIASVKASDQAIDVPDFPTLQLQEASAQGIDIPDFPMLQLQEASAQGIDVPDFPTLQLQEASAQGIDVPDFPTLQLQEASTQAIDIPDFPMLQLQEASDQAIDVPDFPMPLAGEVSYRKKEQPTRDIFEVCQLDYAWVVLKAIQVLNEIQQVINRKVLKNFDNVRKEVSEGRDKILRAAAEDIKEMYWER
ncbi:hypothetical protein VKT23_004474 [Stygiomarasmius scandens]|uniref:Uncharacterized protein n=1 Tax=Marasmiellus scandens TaxID=2682957 RepID=A0ABR1JXD7_9AGAR